MKSVLSFLALSFLTSCAAPSLKRSPASNDGTTQLTREGDRCELNLDGDKEVDTVELGELLGRRVAIIVQPKVVGPARFTVEELSPGQNVVCIKNLEPGTPFQGTDEEQKAIRVNLPADYIRIGKPSSEARFVYYDASEAKYRSIYRGD